VTILVKKIQKKGSAAQASCGKTARQYGEQKFERAMSSKRDGGAVTKEGRRSAFMGEWGGEGIWKM